MRLTDWILYDQSITRFKIESVLNLDKDYEGLEIYKPKPLENVLEINFSNYNSKENNYLDEFCWFEVRIMDSVEEYEKNYCNFNLLFEAILYSDTWAINKGYEINNPLFIPDIGKPDCLKRNLDCGY